MTSNLAILGGPSVRTEEWPKWPRADANTERLLVDVLHSGRWAISGMYNGEKTYERRFAEAFAGYEATKYCVPVCNGSAALTVALQALGVGYGDEVIVPGLVWVACASSVARIGGIPVLADIEPDTLCISANAVRKLITPKTRAIMIVHLYSGMADLDAFVALSKDTSIPLVEDCSQSHGATWNGTRVGSFGTIGAFSTQDSKLLTSGEGGITVTDSHDLYLRLQQLRDDGRVYHKSPPPTGHPDIEEIGVVQGHNYCMSEFHAAILLDRLQHLDDENHCREINADYLKQLLSQVGDIYPLRRLPQVGIATYYHFCVRINREAFGNLNIEMIRQALVAELGVFMEPVDDPLNNNLLFNPLRSTRTSEENRPFLDPSRFNLPEAHKARQECLTFPHFALLGNRKAMEDIATAFAKVRANWTELVPLAREKNLVGAGQQEIPPVISD